MFATYEFATSEAVHVSNNHYYLMLHDIKIGFSYTFHILFPLKNIVVYNTIKLNNIYIYMVPTEFQKFLCWKIKILCWQKLKNQRLLL